MLEDSNINIQAINIEPYTLIDTVSSTEFYTALSINGNNGSTPYWRIKRTIQVGSVWITGYPSGDQSYAYIWDNRFGYTYS
jgi:hypothetical protein